jgi:hypothetical protein
MKQLLHDIRVLGFWQGLKYWRIRNACRREPERVFRWIASCDQEAVRCMERGDLPGMRAPWIYQGP